MSFSLRKHLSNSAIALTLVFAAGACQSLAGTISNQANASPLPDTANAPAVTPQTADQKYQEYLSKYKAQQHEGVAYDTTLESEKFKKVLKYVLENAARSDLDTASLNDAARAGMNSFVEGVRSGKISEAINDQNLLTAALNGMMSHVSPHDAYLPPATAEDFQNSMSNQFGGLGIHYQPSDGSITVDETMEDSPAQKAGVQRGDIIRGVNDISFEGKNSDEIGKLLKGEPGTSAVLKIERNGQNIVVPVTRAIITAKQAHYKMLEGGVAHIRLTTFGQNANIEIKHAISQAKADALVNPATRSTGGLKGVVLDLRYNGGGLLEEARKIVDDYLDKEGLVASQIGRKPEFGQRETSTFGDILNGLPLVVLVNELSASASEVVAGALQDHNRATIMGSDTFGKGTVQTVNPSVLDDGSAVKSTIALYRRPAGTSPQYVGVHPDIKVEILDPEYLDFISKLKRERDMPRSIPNSRGLAAEQFRTKSACTATPAAVSLTPESSSDKNIFLNSGKVDPFITCARDFILKSADASYAPTLTTTRQLQPAATPTQ